MHCIDVGKEELAYGCIRFQCLHAFQFGHMSVPMITPRMGPRLGNQNPLRLAEPSRSRCLKSFETTSQKVPKTYVSTSAHCVTDGQGFILSRILLHFGSFSTDASI